ncbi:MAG: hypothetical protein O3A84_04200 [Proteobacteria bacterium]|nr:hypothetical protein [Pseudomonadota bacterium]
MDSEHLSDREKMAVLWAEHVTKNTARDHDDIYLKVREHFSEVEIIELTLMSGFFNMFNRLMDSLKVPLEIQGEVDKIQRSLHLDPEKVKNYMATMVEDWPDKIPGPNPD